MPFIANLYQKAQIRNALTGLILIDLITFISYAIFTSGIVYHGDIQMVIGCVIGVHFTLINIKKNQSILIYGIIVGISGCILAAISITMFDWVYFSEPISNLLMIFVFYLIEAIIIGLLIGFLISVYYNHKSKSHSALSSQDEELLKSLID